jgi:hypothetical protein
MLPNMRRFGGGLLALALIAGAAGAIAREPDAPDPTAAVLELAPDLPEAAVKDPLVLFAEPDHAAQLEAVLGYAVLPQPTRHNARTRWRLINDFGAHPDAESDDALLTRLALSRRLMLGSDLSAAFYLSGRLSGVRTQHRT